MSKRELLDDDGENKAVRTFLSAYSCDRSVRIGDMRQHMAMSGWDGLWPEWVDTTQFPDAGLTKCGAQDWLRHLFALERDA